MAAGDLQPLVFLDYHQMQTTLTQEAILGSSTKRIKVVLCFWSSLRYSHCVDRNASVWTRTSGNFFI
jgi:hypothetical protein